MVVHCGRLTECRATVRNPEYRMKILAQCETKALRPIARNYSFCFPFLAGFFTPQTL